MLTWMASSIWSTLSGLAHGLSAKGWLKSTRLPVRVISVGNIQVGGAGKTPLVARIAVEAHEQGLKACILCRGYGGQWEQSGGLILPGASSPRAMECGDEAALLHDLAPHALIAVGSDRVRQFEKARLTPEGQAIDLVILDDGFQHWKIKKDIEVVALTSASRRRILFRDWTRALAHAELVVWTKGDVRPETWGRPLVRVRYRLAGPLNPQQAYWLVSGVADGRSVLRLARDSGYRIERHISFPDHARYAEPMVRDLIEDAVRAGADIAVTGKDWVKWRDMGFVPADAARISVLEPELEWLEGRDQWSRLLWGH
jgi:tetraacyldisaccharide 4'-kinase